MADPRQIPWDWLSAQQRLGQGRVSDPSQDRISASTTPDWWWQQQRYRESQTPGLIERPEDVQALEFGSLGDPVSQLAFLAAPGLVRGGKAALEVAAQPGPSRLLRQGFRAGERGNLGPPPVSATGEVLPESMVRDETGQLKRLYHGTGRVFPDFDMAQAGSGAGGDLYGPGIYTTEHAGIASEYARGNAFQTFDTLEAAQTQAQLQGTEVVPVRLGGEIVSYKVPTTQRWANVRSVYADLKRPFDVESTMSVEDARQLADALGMREAFRDTALSPTRLRGGRVENDRLYDFLVRNYGDDKGQANQALQRAGYDGITHIGGGVTGGQPHRVYIAFSPETVYPSVNVDALRNLSTQYPPP